MQPAASTIPGVLMMPDYRSDNPYQVLLAVALQRSGCRVEFPMGYRRGLPLWRAAREHADARVLHLHWLSPYLRGRRVAAFLFSALKFIIDAALVRLSGRRIVWTLHNLVPHEARFPSLEIYARRLLCKMSSAVIVHGSAGRDEVVSRFGCGPEKIFLIPHGHYRTAYPPPTSQQAAREVLGLEPARTIFLFFGMIRPYKGLTRLLRAWAKASLTDAQLLIAGACLPEYRSELESLLKDVTGVIWHDRRIADEHVSHYFTAADVVVLPFERVQTSGSVVLAMSYGKPVIAPRLGDVPETLAGADDLLFPPGDGAALAERLSQAATTDLSHLATRTARAAERLDWALIGRRTGIVYSQAIAAESSPMTL